jgi:hypothetical protein
MTKMTPDQILEIDAKRNHPPGTVAGNLRADINNELRQGGQIVQDGNVLIVFRSVEPGVVEHHSFNADTPQNLIEANKKLWYMLKKIGIKKARTFYENPKVTKLFDSVKGEFDVSISEKDGGFVAEVRL